MGYLLYIYRYLYSLCLSYFTADFSFKFQPGGQVQALRNAAGPDILEICGLAGWFWKICSQKLKPVEVETPYLTSGWIWSWPRLRGTHHQPFSSFGEVAGVSVVLVHKPISVKSSKLRDNKFCPWRIRREHAMLQTATFSGFVLFNNLLLDIRM